MLDFNGNGEADAVLVNGQIIRLADRYTPAVAAPSAQMPAGLDSDGDDGDDGDDDGPIGIVDGPVEIFDAPLCTEAPSDLNLEADRHFSESCRASWPELVPASEAAAAGTSNGAHGLVAIEGAPWEPADTSDIGCTVPAALERQQHL